MLEDMLEIPVYGIRIRDGTLYLPPLHKVIRPGVPQYFPQLTLQKASPQLVPCDSPGKTRPRAEQIQL